jgi:outer membrane receptor for ferrienterochelin and colicin
MHPLFYQPGSWKATCCAVLLSCLAFGPGLYGQNSIESYSDKDLDKLSLEDAVNVGLSKEVTSVSKVAENYLKAPATIVIITADDIRRRGYLDLEQVLHDLPGFDITRGNGTDYSTVYQRGYRSNNTDRTLLLIDGVEENDLWKGNVWLSRQYPLSNIQRIEVVYGPASTMYGANAFLGVINVITKNAEDITSRKVGVTGQVGYGSWNTRYADVTMAGQHDDVSLTLTGRLYQSNEMDLSKYADYDYDLSDYDLEYYKGKLGIADNGLAARAKTLDSTAYYGDVSKLNGRAPHYSNQTNDWLLSGKLRVRDFTLGFQTWKRSEGFGGWYRDDYETGPDHGGKWVPKNTFLYARYDRKLNDRLSILSFTRFKVHQLSDESQENYFIGYLNGELKADALAKATNPYWDVTYWSVLSFQLRTELRASYAFSDKLNLIVGTEHRYGHIQGEYVSGRQENVSETGFPRDKAKTGLPGGNHYFNVDRAAYAQLNYLPLSNLSLGAGGRVDHNSIRRTGGYGTVFNPRLSAVYTPSNWVFKAIYSEAFKDADNWTKFSTTPARLLPNPGLEPEKVRNLELSAGKYLTKHLRAEVIGYRASYSNVVGTAGVEYTDADGKTVHTTQHQPVGSLLIAGLAGQLTYEAGGYSLWANYTFTDPHSREGEGLVRIGDIASHALRFGGEATYFEKLNLNLRANWVGTKPTGKNTSVHTNPYDQIDGYLVLNGAVSYRFLPGLTAQVAVNNLLNAEYFHPGVRSADGNYYAARIPQNERNVMVKLVFAY